MGCILKGGTGLYSREVVGAVLLAAGSASRMGNRPKALLQLGGVPLVRRQLIALSGAGVDELVVVLGAHADHIIPLVEDFPVTLIQNPKPADGQTASLRLGLAALNSKVDAVLIALVDQPLLGAQDIQDLIAAYKKRPEGTQVVQPTVQGNPGNPVMFSAAVREAILSENTAIGCRHWQAQHPQQVHRWATDNLRYRTDVDTPQDIEALAQRTGHCLQWPAHLSCADSNACSSSNTS